MKMVKHVVDPDFSPDPAYAALLRPRPLMLSEETKGWLVFVLSLTPVIAMLIGAALYTAWLHHQTEVEAIRAGLIQGKIDGKDGVYWVEPAGGRPNKVGARP